jgi:hypothetical protein
LIAPLAARLRRQNSSVYCIDTDLDAVLGVANLLSSSLPEDAKYIHSDFLDWSALPQIPKFDCIVMNPPFAATKSQLKRLDFGYCDVPASPRYMPLEAAFLCKALDLLAHKGRLLAIVPCSIVMSESLQWLRDKMFSEGAVRFVHELPPKTFTSVESRMYLMVFDKGCRQRSITLLNHDLHEPERLSVRLTNGVTNRLDFGFVNSSQIVARLRGVDWLGWISLSEMAQVIRGDINSPTGPECAVHTTDFRGGYFQSSDRHDSTVVRYADRRIKRGDILISRIGRNAYRSCGVGIGIEGMACSDCILIVRPANRELSLKILFALKIVLSQDWSKTLLMRGTGASYISQSSLLNLLIPMGFTDHHSDLFKAFADGVRVRSKNKPEQAVQAASCLIQGILDRC